MRMTERIKRNMQTDKPMTLISLRLPDHVIEDLKEVAHLLALGGTRLSSGPTFSSYFEWAPQTPGREGSATGKG